MKVCNEICEVNAKIKNVNLKISAIKKENERITALKIKIKNSVISIKDSIFSKMNRSTNFMLNVTESIGGICVDGRHMATKSPVSVKSCEFFS